KLHAFVVMSHHVHLLIGLPEDMAAPRHMQKFKERSANERMPSLSKEELKDFDMQKGLNRSTFWKSGFRAFPATQHRVFVQKRNYIHMNPVRAGFVELPWEYPLSSSSQLIAGKWTPDLGLPLIRDPGE
ncbi:MAG: transposase, partial [Armatimonadota bacterium]